MINIKRNKKEIAVGLLCAVDEECRILIKKVSKPVTKRIGNTRFIKGTVEGRSIILARTGIGKVNAAHAATLLAEHFRPGCIISFGIGGAYPGTGCGVGDVLVAESEYYADEGIEDRTGFSDLRETGIPVIRKGNRTCYNEFPADRRLLRSFRKIERKLSTAVHYGRFLTVSTVTGTVKKGRMMRDTFQGICENMEGAAVFHVANIYGIPPFEIRGVSNLVEDRDREKWDIPTAAEAVQSSLYTFLREL